MVDSWRLCYLGDLAILEDIAILGDLATLWSLDYDALVLIDVLEGLLHLVVSYIWRLSHSLDGGLIGGLLSAHIFWRILSALAWRIHFSLFIGGYISALGLRRGHGGFVDDLVALIDDMEALVH